MKLLKKLLSSSAVKWVLSTAGTVVLDGAYDDLRGRSEKVGGDTSGKKKDSTSGPSSHAEHMEAKGGKKIVDEVFTEIAKYDAVKSGEVSEEELGWLEEVLGDLDEGQVERFTDLVGHMAERIESTSSSPEFVLDGKKGLNIQRKTDTKQTSTTVNIKNEPGRKIIVILITTARESSGNPTKKSYEETFKAKILQGLKAKNVLYTPRYKFKKTVDGIVKKVETPVKVILHDLNSPASIQNDLDRIAELKQRAQDRKNKKRRK